MISTFLLIAFYTLIFSLIIWRAKFFAIEGFSKLFVLSFFLLKVVVGILYVWLHAKYFHGADLYFYFRDSQIVGSTLYSHPLTFLELTFGPNGPHYIPPHLAKYIYAMGFWGDVSAYMMVRLNVIFNLFSFAHFYVNTVFMSFISFCGFVLLLKAISSLATNPRVHASIRLTYYLIMFTPSILFWCTGFHKETLIVFGISATLYCLWQLGIPGRFRIGYLIALLLSLALVYATRDFVFYLLIPAIIALIWTHYFPKYIPLKYLLVYSAVIVLGLFARMPFYHLTFLQMIEAKHDAFQRLRGSSFIHIPPVATFKDVILNTPRALLNTMFRPDPLDARNTWEVIMSIENMLLIGFILFQAYNLLMHLRTQLLSISFFLFALIFSLSLFAIIGLIVPNLGAIARYRSVPLLFLVLALSLIPIKRSSP